MQMYDDDIARRWLGSKSDFLRALFTNNVLVFKASSSCNGGAMLLIYLSSEVR